MRRTASACCSTAACTPMRRSTRRINNVVRGLIEVGVRQGAHVGVLMETRPSALVAIAALSRLGAVAVLMPPDADLADCGAARRRCREIIADPSNLEAARRLSMRVLVLGGGEIARPASAAERRRRRRHGEDRPGRGGTARLVPAQPGLAKRPRVRRVQHQVGGELVARQITNFRWALSAFGTASAANLGRRRHRVLPDPAAPPVRPAGQPGRRGGRRLPHRAVARPGLRPVRAGDPPVRRDGGVLHVGDAARGHRRPVVRAERATTRCGCSSVRACRPGCGSGSSTSSRPRTSSSSSPPPTDRPCWPTCPGAKIGSKGRPLPGAAQVELAAYDADDDLILEDDRGFVRKADTERGRRACWRIRAGPIDPTASVKRGVFSPGRHLGVHRVPVPARPATATTGWWTTAARSSAPTAARSTPRRSTTRSA